MVALLCVFLLALNRAWSYTLAALLKAFSEAINGLPHVRIPGHDVPPWYALANAVDWLNGVVLNAIGVGIQNTEKALHALIGWLAYAWQATADEVAALAEDTAQGFDWVKNVAIRSALGVALAPIIAELYHL